MKKKTFGTKKKIPLPIPEAKQFLAFIKMMKCRKNCRIINHKEAQELGIEK